MRIGLIILALLLALVILIRMSTPPPPAPRPCCGDLSATPPFAPRTAPVLSSNASQVPIELQGCGVNREEITAIAISGAFVGCVSVENGANMRFPSSLALFFTLDGARCQGTPGPLQRRVDLENVTYTASIRRGPPFCIVESSVTYSRFESSDPAFAMLFATRGPQTLTPVLDRFALGWLSAGLMACPPNPIPVGVVTRCPS